MTYAYSNDGFSFRAVADDYAPSKDEILFADVATDDQLKKVFPNFVAKQEKASICQQITNLESTITMRRIREACLGVDDGFMKDIDEKIATLREGL